MIRFNIDFEWLLLTPLVAFTRDEQDPKGTICLSIGWLFFSLHIFF